METIQLIDRSTLLSLYNLATSNSFLELIFSVLAVITVYVVPLFFIWNWLKNTDNPIVNRIVTLQVFFGGIVGWQVISKLVKAFYFRARPFQNTTIDVKELLIHRPDQSFPSDHASLLFGITFSLYFFGQKRLANCFLIISILVSAARIATGLHYFSDILGGAAVGLMSALIIFILKEPLEKYIAIPLINFSKKLNLS